MASLERMARPPRIGTMASSTMRRRVLASAALGEWPVVRAAVEEEGCSLNIQDEATGLSFAHWAAYQGDLATLEWLQSCGAFLRLRDQRGEAPLAGAKAAACRELLLAAAYSPVEQVLYAAGAGGAGSAPALPLLPRLEALPGDLVDEPLWDEEGASLLGCLVARHGQQLSAAQAAQEEASSSSSASSGGSRRPHVFCALPALRWLAAQGADLEHLDEAGNGLLHLVDWAQGFEVLAPLLRWALRGGGEAESDVGNAAESADGVGEQHLDRRNREGDTPALLCTYHAPTGGDVLRCLQLLEAAGANLAIPNGQGLSATMSLARYHGDGPWLKWCQDKAGVEPSACCAAGRTVADYLAMHESGQDEDE